MLLYAVSLAGSLAVQATQGPEYSFRLLPNSGKTVLLSNSGKTVVLHLLHLDVAGGHNIYVHA